jgi:hypothetical protein
MNDDQKAFPLVSAEDYQKMMDCLMKIARNDNTMDDTTYCYIAGETLKELGIEYERT